MSDELGSRTLGFPRSPHNPAIEKWFQAASSRPDSLRKLARTIGLQPVSTGSPTAKMEESVDNPFSTIMMGDSLISRPSSVIEEGGQAYTRSSIGRAMFDGKPANGIFPEVGHEKDWLVMIRLTDGWPGEEIAFTRTGHVTHHFCLVEPEGLVSYAWRRTDFPASFEVHAEDVDVVLTFRGDDTLATCEVDGAGSLDCLTGNGVPLVYDVPACWSDLSAVRLFGPASVTGSAKLMERLESLSRNAELPALTHLTVSVDDSIDEVILKRLLDAASLKTFNLEGDKNRTERLRRLLQPGTRTTIGMR